jgi:hypothetical protein
MGIVLRNTRSVEIKGPYLVLAADLRFVNWNIWSHLSFCYAFFLSR